MRGVAAITGRGGWRRMAQVAACLLLLTVAPACSRAAQAAVGPLSKAPDGRKLELTFQEEFDHFRPWRGDKGVWRTTFGDGSAPGLGTRTLSANKEVQLYVDRDMADAAGPIGLDDVAFEVDVVARRIDGSEHRRISLRSVDEQFDHVSAHQWLAQRPHQAPCMAAHCHAARVALVRRVRVVGPPARPQRSRQSSQAPRALQGLGRAASDQAFIRVVRIAHSVRVTGAQAP